MNNAAPMRKATPRGQMTRGNNSGPAVMLMPPDIRSTFMPNPPLEPVPPVVHRRKQKWSAVATLLTRVAEELSKRPVPPNVEPSNPPGADATTATTAATATAPLTVSEQRKQAKMQQHQVELQPLISEYRKEQRECKGEFKGMNCYNTLFVGRLAYEVTERKLLREMEAFGPVKDIQIVKASKSVSSTSEPVPSSSRGYAFVEYEHEDDMKRAYRAADGMRLDGREIVVDVERGHTVPDWLPRRLGGGLGGTRLGGRHVNVTRPGRFDPHRPHVVVPHNALMPPIMPPLYNHGNNGNNNGAPIMGRGSGPPLSGYGGYSGNNGGPAAAAPYGNDRYGAAPGRGPPPNDWDRRGGGGTDYDRNKRRRSRSPEQRYGARRGRY